VKRGGRPERFGLSFKRENGTSPISQEVGKRDEEGKRDVTYIAGGGGAEDRRFRLVAPAHCGNTMVNP
jgi:hypothetical protein